MPIIPNVPMVFHCTECGWSSDIKSDAFSIPSICLDCGSEEIKLEKAHKIIEKLKKKFGL